MQIQKLSTGLSKIKHHFPGYSISKQQLVLEVLSSVQAFSEGPAVQVPGAALRQLGLLEPGPLETRLEAMPPPPQTEKLAYGEGVACPSYIASAVEQGLEPWSLGSHLGVLTPSLSTDP